MSSRTLAQMTGTFEANTTDEVTQASDICENCAFGKISQKPVPKVSNNKTTQKLERVFSDVMGSLFPSSIGGSRCAICLIDEFSGYVVVKFTKYKTQPLKTFKEYVAQYVRLKILRTDNGNE